MSLPVLSCHACGLPLTTMSLNLATLFSHLQSENVEFMQFAFRWMNCLLMREISVKNTIRMWDTYLVCPSRPNPGCFLTDSAGRRSGCILTVSFICLLCIPHQLEQKAARDGFSGMPPVTFSCSVQRSLIIVFQGIIMFLQSLPTQSWGDHEIELLLSHAFVLNATWQNAQSHFLGS